MKKVGIVIAILSALVIAGCASTGGGGGGGGADLEPFTVDLSTLPYVRNANAFTKGWDDHFIKLPEFPVDVTQYQRVTIRAKYFDAEGTEIEQSDSRIMVVLILDPDGDWRGPAMEPGPNTPLKEFNVGGFSGLVSTDRGVRVRLRRAPGGILFQNNPGGGVAFVEITELTFHNGR